jgi:hypothetical protein
VFCDARSLQQHSSSSSAAPGVLQQWDMNAAAAAAVAVDKQCNAAAAAAGQSTMTGACGIPAAAAGAEGDEPVKVFKGRLSGAAAAIRAVQQQQQQQTPHLQQQQQARQQQCGSSRVVNLAGAPVQQQQQGVGDSSELLVVPFEFKTGKDYFSHKAQVGPLLPVTFSSTCTAGVLHLLQLSIVPLSVRTLLDSIFQQAAFNDQTNSTNAYCQASSTMFNALSIAYVRARYRPCNCSI